MNNPKRIQFTNGNVTKYVYSATGEKLRTIYQTAVPNITVAAGTAHELTNAEILYTDSVDYYHGGKLTVRNGRLDKYYFDGGYAQATMDEASQSDTFAFFYYTADHLGNIREVIDESGTIQQITSYYPFGTPFATEAGNINADLQTHKYNGKEFDTMHGLNTYDYGARQYNSLFGRWDRIDPLCEKYYSVSPYAYCANNPVNLIDPDGRDNYRLNRDGTIELIENTSDDFHMIYSMNQDKNIDMGNPLKISKTFFDSIEQKTIKGKASSEKGGDISSYHITIYTNKDSNESSQFFEFVVNNTEVEWSLVETPNYSYVGTSNSSGDDVSNPYLMDNAHENKVPVIKNIHSHGYDNPTPSPGDISLVRRYQKQPNGAPNAKFFIYDRVGYHQFDSNTPTCPEFIFVKKR